MQPILMQAADFSFAPLRTLSLLIDFPEAPQKWEMSRELGQWNCRCELPPGEYGYRFLVNEALELNDPQANVYQPDAENKLWSYLRIGSDGKRRYNWEPYPVTLTGFAVTSVVGEKLPALQKKKFNLHVDKQAAAGFQFSNVSGLHTVTTAWFGPTGTLYEYSESILCGETGGEPILWFWLPLDSTSPQGRWRFTLFVDGEALLTDYFLAEQQNVYSYNRFQNK